MVVKELDPLEPDSLSLYPLQLTNTGTGAWELTPLSLSSLIREMTTFIEATPLEY